LAGLDEENLTIVRNDMKNILLDMTSPSPPNFALTLAARGIQTSDSCFAFPSHSQVRAAWDNSL
jgi:hypothetical protein